MYYISHMRLESIGKNKNFTKFLLLICWYFDYNEVTMRGEVDEKSTQKKI